MNPKQPCMVFISFPRAIVLGGWHKYDIYLNRELIGTGTYAAGTDTLVAVPVGVHQLLVANRTRFKKPHQFDIELEEPGLYLARVSFKAWFGYWKRPEIIKLQAQWLVAH